jgi:hypothetical protein
MEEVKSLTVARREAQMFEVLALLFSNPTLTQIEACSQVGITPDTFQRWVKSDPEFVDSVRILIMETEKLGMLDLQLAYLEGVSRISSRLKSPVDMSDKDYLELHKYAGEMVNELQRTYHTAPGIEEDAHAFLRRGPKTKSQQSRFASLDIEATETGIRVGFNREDDVIEAQFSQQLSEDTSEDSPEVPESP